MEYTLNEVYDYVLDRLDKKGSDFIQLPEMLRLFRTHTLDFIGERAPIVEKTQQITSDLQPLIDSLRFDVIDDPQDPYVKLCAIPKYVLHLVRVNALFKGHISGRRPTLIRHGNLDAYMADPNKRPTHEYPLIVQYLDYVKIYTGYQKKAQYAFLTFIRRPEFALISEPTKRIVNMPDEAIEDIIMKVVVDYSGSKSDDRVQTNMIQEQSFRRK